MFRRRSAGATDGTAQDSPGAQSPDGPADTKPRSPAEAAKGRPTPKRSVAEAKRRQPITGSSRAAAAAPRTKEEKAKARTNRAGRYEAMRRGEAWALNPRDRGPARALARDFVDSKRRVSEYYMYILVVLLAAVFVRSAAAQAIISPVVLLLILVIVVDAHADPAQPGPADGRTAARRVHPGPDHVRGDAGAADPQVPGADPACPPRRQDLTLAPFTALRVRML